MRPDVAAIVDSIKDRIAERRARGEYPPGLEQQLEWEFQHLIDATNRRVLASEKLAGHVRSLDVYLKESGNLDEATHRLKDIMMVMVDVIAQTEDADRRLVRELNHHIMDRISVVDHLAVLLTELESRISGLEQDAEPR